MQGTTRQEKVYSFLQGGGEMGELTRTFDWSQTAIGLPATWPQSLRNYISLILNSRFPMFLFWGPQHICFYNDAYRPSLGNSGKHPALLGMPGKEAWPEIWDFIGPMITEIINGGEGTWFENQLVPIYRNGHIEDVYWTFGYSAVLNDAGNREGILVTCTETTKTVAHLSQVKKSEERFQNLVRDATAAIVVLTGEEMKVEIVNEAYGRLIELTPEDLLNRPLFDVIPDAKEYYLPLLEKVTQTGEPVHLYDSPYSVVTNGKRIDGFLHVVYQPYRDVSGTIIGVMAICQDVTAQVLAKKRIEESEARLEILSNTVPAMIFYLDAGQRYQSYNETFMQWFGVDAKEAIGKTVCEFIGNESYSVVQPHLAKAYTGQQERYEIEGPSRLHGPQWLSVVYTPHKTDDGAVSGVIAHVTDITQSKLAEIELRESEARFRTLVQDAPVAMFIFRGENMMINTANKLALEMIGRTEAAINKPLLEVIPELKDSPAYHIFQEVYRTGQPHYGREVLVPLERAGVLEDRWFNFAYTPFFENGRVTGVMDVATEVTDQVLARQKIEDVVTQRTRELAEANILLGQNNRELEQFAYIASHDLQEPLRKVSTFTEMLRTHLGNVDERSQVYFKKISDSTLRMMNLIRDVLDFSQLSTQRQAFEQVDLGALIDSLISDFELVIEQKEGVIHYHHLPNITANALQMRQLFANLLSNALKFTKEEVPPVITVAALTLSEEDKSTYKDLLPGVDYWLITVADNGIGFSEEHADKIFSIFQRLHGKSEFAGTGIGLALCKKITQNHQGNIWATSEKGEGATFHILLPCLDEWTNTAH